jgi:hypothetical protein
LEESAGYQGSLETFQLAFTREHSGWLSEEQHKLKNEVVNNYQSLLFPKGAPPKKTWKESNSLRWEYPLLPASLGI